MVAFASYKDYLADLQSNMAADEFEPDPILDEHVASAIHVVDCLTKLRRGEGISRIDAFRAGDWLRTVLDGDFLFTCETHEPNDAPPRKK
jgi:hypothetical protein